MPYILTRTNTFNFSDFNKSVIKEDEGIDDLVGRIQDIVHKESIPFSNYWNCLCCLFPRINGSKILPSSTELKNELIQSFKNSLNSHVYRDSPLGVCLTNGNGYLIDCNEAYLFLMHNSKEEAINHQFRDSIHESDNAGSKKKTFQLNKRTSIEQIETRLWRKDGTFFWGQVTLSRIFDLDENPIYIIIQINDITEIKEAQHDLEKKIEERTKELQVQELFVRSLMATNSHEIRTVIGGIVGCSRIIQEDRNILTEDELNDLISSMSFSRTLTKNVK